MRATGAYGNKSVHELTDECLNGERLSVVILLQEGTCSGMKEATVLLTGGATVISVIRAGMPSNSAQDCM